MNEEERLQKLNNSSEFYIFYLGVFLLPSAFTFSAFLLLISSIIGFKNKKSDFLKDKYNLAFLASGILMVISCIYQSIHHENSGLQIWKPELSWIGLGNWIPFFFLSWGFEYFLTIKEERKKCAFAILAGSLPVLLTGIGQVFFNLHGPFEILNGFIIWYSRPLENNVLTGLFNNPNYAGAWLSFVLPLSLAFFRQKQTFIKKMISLSFVALIIFCILLTNSRSAWIGLFISFLLFFGIKSLKWLIPLMISLTALILISIFNDNISLLPNEAINEFSNFKYLDRIEIWKTSIKIIINNPIFGSGAASFSEIYQKISGLKMYHSHNIVLEIAMNYGLPAALFTILPIAKIGLLSFKKINNLKLTSNLIFDRSLITALIVILTTQMVDIQYYDGRISIAIWILIAAVKNIIKENVANKI